MTHDPLDSLDAGLLVVRDVSRRVLAIEGDFRERGLVELADAGLAETAGRAWVSGIAGSLVDDALVQAATARVLSRNGGRPGSALLQVAALSLQALALLCTPAELEALLPLVREKLDLVRPAPPEGRGT